jgi:UDP-2,4-diacetamido-2,4,6-trideoxy-beta-L-altropyranose hydrolase
MNVVFRVDASQSIGTGHVISYLTLAKALKTMGAQCQFLCREHPRNLIDHMHSKVFKVHNLPIVKVIC